jgi:hypothetical protein
MCGPYVQHRRGQFAIRHANIKEEDGVSHRREMKFAHVELTGMCPRTGFGLKRCLIHIRGIRRHTRCSTSCWGHRTQCISSQVEVRTYRGRLPRKVPSSADWEKDSATSRKGEVSRSSSCHVSVASVDETHLNLRRFGEDLGIGRSSHSTQLEKLFTAKEPCYIFTFNYRSKGWFRFPETRKGNVADYHDRAFGGPGDHASISFPVSYD